MSLNGKTALVTGSGGGLGGVIARHLLSQGANVVFCDCNPTRLAALRDDLSSSSSPSADRTLILHVDVADEASVKNLLARTAERFGRLDILVNNAAIMDRFDPAAECDLEMWQRVLAVNLTGPFLLTKHALPHMLPPAQEAQSDEQASDGSNSSDSNSNSNSSRGGALIVNIGSVASYRGLAAGVAYTASKHGVLALTKNTAGTYGRRGVYCVALLMGGMGDTNIVDAFAQGINVQGMELMKETLPGMRLVPTEHVARYVAFLCGEGMASSANGSCIVLNSNWPEA